MELRHTSSLITIHIYFFFYWAAVAAAKSPQSVDLFTYIIVYITGFLVVQLVKNSPAMRETWVQSMGWEDLLEKGKAAHFSILAWKIPWTV